MQDLGIWILFEGNNMIRLLTGLLVTLRIALISVVISFPLGVLFGIFMTLNNSISRVVSIIYLEFIRIMPQLVLLFLAYFGLSKAFNLDLSGETAAIIVFTLWGIAEMGDLVRGALTSIPRHQYDSGFAVGLTKMQVYQYVILPQSVRRLLPPAINLTTRMIKTTALVVLIGVIEVMKVGQQIIEANRHTSPNVALWIYGIIFSLYFLACFPISYLAKRLENRWKGVK